MIRLRKLFARRVLVQDGAAERADVLALVARLRRNAATMERHSNDFAADGRAQMRLCDTLTAEIASGLHEGEARIARVVMKGEQ